MARRAASRCAADMPSSSHSSWLAWPTAQATHHAAMRSNIASRSRLGQHLRVADLVDPRGPAGTTAAPTRQRAGPRAAADLVHADDDVVALVPQRPLELEGRNKLLHRHSGEATSGGLRLKGTPVHERRGADDPLEMDAQGPRPFRSRSYGRTTSTGSSVVSSSRWASWTRWCTNHWCGVVPVTCRNRRANVRGVIAARLRQRIDAQRRVEMLERPMEDEADVLVGATRRHRLIDVLRLPAITMRWYNQPAGDVVGRLGAVVHPHDVEAEVDAGRRSRGGQRSRRRRHRARWGRP